MNKKFIINEMMTNNVHLGHKKNLMNQNMKKFIININKKVHIINLEITFKSLKNISIMLKNIKKNNKSFLIVCVEKKMKKIVKTIFKKMNNPFVCKRWLGGTFTNFETLKTTINNVNYLKIIVKNKNNKLKKKKIETYKKKIKKSMSFLEGLINMKILPEYLFVINVKKNKNALEEAKKMNISTIGIVDTNNSTKNIDYLIPGNDDSYKSIFFFIKKIVKMLNVE
ncbi:30S ribosomal protein S2 [Candidatus Nasuia deltocephalinicola]|uniref:30S ribosomal protein S2 n=1 Tax=Candidatus Nasuia deltocephalincola TaxID=1160784 RepID=UPI00216B2F84|nr:30S ribosomal protein S2 [Candidatus Nasuia deltocephalinicola]